MSCTHADTKRNRHPACPGLASGSIAKDLLNRILELIVLIPLKRSFA